MLFRSVTECEDWLAELISTPVREYTSLEAGLSLLPVLPPDEVARLLGERAERLRMELRTIDASQSVAADLEVPGLFLIESIYRRSMLVAELDFVSTLAADIRSSALVGTKEWQRLHELRADGVTFEQIGQDPIGYLGEGARAFNPDHQA